MSRSQKAVPCGGRRSLSEEEQDKFRRGLVSAPIETGSGVLGEEIWSRKAKRAAKRHRAKRERAMRWEDEL